MNGQQQSTTGRYFDSEHAVSMYRNQQVRSVRLMKFPTLEVEQLFVVVLVYLDQVIESDGAVSLSICATIL